LHAFVTSISQPRHSGVIVRASAKGLALARCCGERSFEAALEAAWDSEQSSGRRPGERQQTTGRRLLEWDCFFQIMTRK